MSESPQGHFGQIDSQSYQEHFAPGDHTLVDVREVHEWVTGRIPGAVHIPLNDLPERIGEISMEKPVVMVCASGSRSMYGGQFLIQSGFPEVYNLSDGTKGWIAKGLPVER